MIPCSSITACNLISSPINLRIQSGEISPKPLNRVISGLPPSFFDRLPAFLFRHSNRSFLSCLLHGTAESPAQIHVLLLYQVRKELQKERSSNSKRNVHAIHICVSCESRYSYTVSHRGPLQCFNACLKQIELLSLVNYFFCQAQSNSMACPAS
jgi:hypothetical protein